MFQTMLDNATRICEAKFGNLLLFDGKDMRVVAMHNAPREHEGIAATQPGHPVGTLDCGSSGHNEKTSCRG